MKRYIILLLACFAFASFSCKKDSENSGKAEHAVWLEKKTVTLFEGDETILRPIYSTGKAPVRTYTWKSSNPEVVDVEPIDAFSAALVGKGPGTAKVVLSSDDGILSVSCDVVVNQFVDDGVMRVLAIGNSFSEDALENYLYDLAKAKGIPIVIGNLYIGGASLDLHWENASGNKAVYEYRKISQTGTRTVAANTSIAAAVADDEWDYISFQQVSQNSGQYQTFTTPLPQLVDYVKERATHRDPQYIMHQTWAYAQTSTHAGFDNYGRNQMTMYNAIVDAVGKAAQLVNADLIVPAGTAIQNGRTSVIGDNFNRDGYHLNLSIGRYTAACAWFETLTGQSVIGNTFKPDAITAYEAEIAQHAAHEAVLKPNEVTVLTDYKGGSTGPLTADVLVDFGENSSAAGWNGVTSMLSGTNLPNLKDKDGKYTGITLTITERFNGQNPDGPGISTTDFNMPESVSKFSYFGNSKADFGGMKIVQSVIKLTGLEKDSKYNFCFFGSRMGVGDNRETAYKLKGKNEAAVYLNTSGNTSKTACASDISPDDNGEILLTVTAGPNNNNGSGFYYISAMRISPGN